MSLPLADEYQSAVQHPSKVFGDPRLARAKAREGRWGMPEVAAGNFAIVFRLADGTRTWAVRCFTHLPQNASRRYAETSAFLGATPHRAFVPVEYLEDGIRVSGKAWPVTVMPWVNGTPLNDWVQDKASESASLRAMREALVALVDGLEQAGVAHGDLQHGNVLVAPGPELKLLDYDGMYLPAFAGWEMPELGHPNYQHPQRGTSKYGARLDRFAALVIWTALKALETDPSLWSDFDNGDNLLFRSSDFANPSQSALFARLRSSTTLRPYADALSRIAAADPDATPSLGDFAAGHGVSKIAQAPLRVGPMAAYPVVDLRHRKMTQPLGTRVIAVGEILDTWSGTTVKGDPYLFIRLGATTGTTLKVVLWSEVLARSDTARSLARVGDIYSVTGVLGVYQAERQIELERLPLLERLDDARVRELIGSGWDQKPPSETKLGTLDVGDVVEHRDFGQGLVVEVDGEIARIKFNYSERRIHFGKFPLRLISRAAGARASPDKARRTQRGGEGPRADPQSPRHSTPASVGRPVTLKEASSLAALYPSAAGKASTSSAAGKASTSSAAGKASTSSAAGKASTSSAAGKASTSSAAGKASTSSAAGKASTSSAAGKASTSSAAGKASTSSAAGKASTSSAAGKASTSSAAGKASTSSAAGKASTSSAAGKASTSSAAGKASPVPQRSSVLAAFGLPEPSGQPAATPRARVRRSDRSRVPTVAAALGLGALLVIVGAAFLTQGGGQHHSDGLAAGPASSADRQQTPMVRPSIEPRPTHTPLPTMNPDSRPTLPPEPRANPPVRPISEEQSIQQDLLARLAPYLDTSQLLRCGPWGRDDEAGPYDPFTSKRPGAQGAVICNRPDPGVKLVAMYKFPTERALRRYWDWRIGRVEPALKGRRDACVLGRSGVTEQLGRGIACYTSDGTAKIKWMDTSTLTYGVADALGGDIDKLHDWWLLNIPSG